MPKTRERLFANISQDMLEGYRDAARGYGLETHGLVFFGMTRGRHFYYEFENGHAVQISVFVNDKGPFFKALEVERYKADNYMPDAKEFPNAEEVNGQMKQISQLPGRERDDDPNWGAGKAKPIGARLVDLGVDAQPRP